MKQLIIILFAVGMSFNVVAQDPTFGGKIGYSTSSLDGDNTDDFDTRYGLALAAFAKYPLGDKFSFQPELQYGSYGAEVVGSDDTKVILDQINFPLKFNFYTGVNGNDGGFKINLGPQVGFSISDKIKDDDNEIDLSDALEEEGGDFSSVDIGGTLNLGYEFNNGIWLETGAFHSISPVIDIDGDKNYNTTGALTIGYNFSY